MVNVKFDFSSNKNTIPASVVRHSHVTSLANTVKYLKLHKNGADKFFFVYENVHACLHCVRTAAENCVCL